MNTYIFLDFDGVLRTTDSPKRVLQSILISNLKDDIENIHSLSIIISSTWREAYGIGELKQHLGPLSEYVVGITPTAPASFDFARERECMAWMRKHGDQPYRYVAIDDQTEQFRTMPVIEINPLKGYQRGLLPKFLSNG